MTPVLLLPGIGNSGPEHWQSRWQTREPAFQRIEVPSWDEPRLEDWLTALATAVQVAAVPPVVVAHSLGCLALVHFAGRGGMVHAALLVAPPDPDGPQFPVVAQSFGPVPRARLPFPSRLVASHDDPYGSFEFAERCARNWGSQLVDAGCAGHLNADSGLGDWPAGRALLTGLLG